MYLDGHCDTVQAVRSRWLESTGVDPYLGAANGAVLRRDALRREQGWLPPDGEWEHLLFGLGAADQLGGVASMMVASRIMRELRPEGALRGVIVRGMITPAEEDNEGGGPAFLMQRVLPGAPAEMLPDLVVLTEPSGDARTGALCIYRGQRGRAQVEVTVTGRSSHGSVPAEGLNPLEHGGAILAEAARRAAAGVGLGDHPFLGPGTRTASAGSLESPSNCAVPQRFTFRFDRRLTANESAGQAVAEIDSLPSVRAARAAGLTVEIGVPRYEQATWHGYAVSNPQAYPAWLTPEDHPAVGAAVAAYRAVVSPHVTAGGSGGALRVEPRVGRCPFSTDGVG
ncbi:MAG TPA: M20/M25/M40 family metallo-hydrolase, partial [Dongiaceae bacterium]|nr:M20/M25/M40 family metallo-hydrolase [Dongiaceae bacterium]